MPAGQLTRRAGRGCSASGIIDPCICRSERRLKTTIAEQPIVSAKPKPSEDRHNYVRSHLRFGWWSLLLFLTLGMVLEGLHGFKVAWYLNVSTQTRRLLWTLAHAHGTALGLVHIAF